MDQGSPSAKQCKNVRDYQIVREVGRGGFGVVYEANHPKFGAVALKVFSSKGRSYRIASEIDTLKSVKFPFVVKYYEDFVEDGIQYMAMELCRLGSIRDHVRRKGPISERAAACILYQLARVVRKLHQNNIMHRDLSAGNVLIYKVYNVDKFKVKVCDFGLVTKINDNRGQAMTVVGTPGYMAPQVFNQNYDQKADIYSLGGVLYMMLSGRDPPRDHDMSRPEAELDYRGMSAPAIDLIKNMRERNPELRYSITQIMICQFVMENYKNLPIDPDCSLDLYLAWQRDRSQGRSLVSSDAQRFSSLHAPARAVAAAPELQPQPQYVRPAASYPRSRPQSNPPPSSRDVLAANVAGSGYGRDKPSAATRESGFASAGTADYRLSRPSTRGQVADAGGDMWAQRRPAAAADVREMIRAPRDEVPPSNTDRDWLISLRRCAGQKNLHESGRFLIVDEYTAIVEQISRGCVANIVRVELIGDRRQKVYFLRPRYERTPAPQLDDPPVTTEDPHYGRCHESLATMSDEERSTFRKLRTAITCLRNRVCKVLWRSPNHFVGASARLMEGGDFRLLTIETRICRKFGTTSYKCELRRQMIVDANEIERLNATYEILRRAEAAWQSANLQFPLIYQHYMSEMDSKDKANMARPLSCATASSSHTSTNAAMPLITSRAASERIAGRILAPNTLLENVDSVRTAPSVLQHAANGARSRRRSTSCETRQNQPQPQRMLSSWQQDENIGFKIKRSTKSTRPDIVMTGDQTRTLRASTEVKDRFTFIDTAPNGTKSETRFYCYEPFSDLNGVPERAQPLLQELLFIWKRDNFI